MTLFAAVKTMVGLDWTMVGLFFLVLILIPTLASRKGASSSKEFFLSGRSMPWWLLGISMVAATTSTNSANLFTELIRDKGGISGNWKWWAFLLTGMLTVFVYAKLWRRSGVTTDIEFYELRYSGKPAAFLRCFRGLYLGMLFNLIVMAFVTLGAVKIGVIVFGVDPWLIYVVTTVSAIVYAAFGGLRGMVYTDLFLFALVMVGAVVSMVFTLGHVGGLHALVAHAAVAPKLNFFPDFAHANTDLLIMIFIIPLAVQWWNVWWPGSEPGGGGYIVQRMLSAKNENHAVGAALFFNVMNYALRPWPWFIVGLASIIVFPQLADIQAAFPKVDPKLVGHDMAYPAMMTVIPSGWYGLTVASLMGALFSTLAAHINMGASYIVNDFYRRFVRIGVASGQPHHLWCEKNKQKGHGNAQDQRQQNRRPDNFIGVFPPLFTLSSGNQRRNCHIDPDEQRQPDEFRLRCQADGCHSIAAQLGHHHRVYHACQRNEEALQ